MSANPHPHQNFVITGEAEHGTGRVRMYKHPEVWEHLPQLLGADPIYNVNGHGLEYLTCSICFPNAGQVEDNRRAPGA